MNNHLHEIFNEIKNNNKILILPHINPDGDALGSCFGLKHALLQYFPEKNIKVVYEQESNYLDFLGQSDDWTEWLDNSFITIILDTANEERINQQYYLKSRTIINIDHHITNTYYGDLNFVIPQTSSACEVVAFILKKWFKNINDDSKEALYTGIITDSNRFLYNSTSQQTLEIASWLYTNNASIQNIYNNLYLSSKIDFNILEYIYKKIKINNYIGYYIIDKQDLEKYKLKGFEFKKYISLLNWYKDIKIWFSVIWSEEDKYYKISLRSRNYNLIPLAVEYNGGGHRNACGLKINNINELNEIIKKLNKLIMG